MELVIRKSQFARIENISRGRVTQLIKMGVIKQRPDGKLLAKEAIEALILYRHRPRRKTLKESSAPELEIDLNEELKKFSKELEKRPGSDFTSRRNEKI